MKTKTIGLVSPGRFEDGDLTINGQDLSSVVVQADDADGELRAAINDLDGISAELSELGELVLSFSASLVVDGLDPSGQGATFFSAGEYE